MISASHAEDWDFLARKTRGQPLIYGAPKIKRSVHQVDIHRGTPWGLLIITGIVLCFFGPLFLHIKNMSLSGQIFTVLFAIPFLSGWLYLFSQRSELSWEDGRGELYIDYRRLLSSRKIALPTNGLKITIQQNASKWGGHAILVLNSKVGSQPINLIAAQTTASLMRAFKEMSTLLGCEPIEETVNFTLADGSFLTISKLSLSAPSASFRTMRMSMPDLETIIFKPALGHWLFMFAFLITGLFCLSMLIGEIYQLSWSGIALAGALGIVFTGFSISGIFIGFGTRRVIVNKRQQRFSIKSGLGGPKIGWCEYHLRDIAAMQICSRYVEANDPPGYTNYELNAVLSHPPGHRFNLLSHGNRLALESEAERLADFINKPLLNHIQREIG